MPTMEIYSAAAIATLCAGLDGLHPHCQESLLRVHGDSLWVWLTTARARRRPLCRETRTVLAASFPFPWALRGGMLSLPTSPSSSPAPRCQEALFCLATPSLAHGVPPANDRSPLSSAVPLPGPAAILSLGGGWPQACGVWGQPGPGTQPFPKPSRGVLRCITSELVRGLPAACVQNQGCAGREEQLFIVEIQCHMDPACHLAPHHPTHFPILPSCTALSCHAGTISHKLQLISWLGALAGTFPPNSHYFSSTEKLHEGFPSLQTLLRTRRLCYSKANCKAFFKRMFR